MRSADLGLARAAARAQHVDRVADADRVRAQLREQRAEDARAGERVGQRAVHLLDLDPERVGERGELALTRQRREAAGERDRAERRRVGPVQAGALECLGEHARVEAGVVGDQHAALQQRLELGEHLLGRRRAVDHVLADAGEALDPASQRPLDAHERVEALVQLAAADEHRADLGQLAELAGEPVRLGVDGDELGGGQRVVEQIHGTAMQARGSDGTQTSVRIDPSVYGPEGRPEDQRASAALQPARRGAHAARVRGVRARQQRRQQPGRQRQQREQPEHGARAVRIRDRPEQRRDQAADADRQSERDAGGEARSRRQVALAHHDGDAERPHRDEAEQRRRQRGGQRAVDAQQQRQQQRLQHHRAEQHESRIDPVGHPPPDQRAQRARGQQCGERCVGGAVGGAEVLHEVAREERLHAEVDARAQRRDRADLRERAPAIGLGRRVGVLGARSAQRRRMQCEQRGADQAGDEHHDRPGQAEQQHRGRDHHRREREAGVAADREEAEARRHACARGRAARRAASGWKRPTPSPPTATAASSRPYEDTAPQTATPVPASTSPSGMKKLRELRSATRPNSGCSTEEQTVIVTSRSLVAPKESPRWEIRKGNSAGTAPWHMSAQACPAESVASARRSNPAGTRPRLEGAKSSCCGLSLVPMPRSTAVYACSACGHESPKWHGRCPGCGEWNTLAEEARAAAPARAGGGAKRTARALRPVPLSEVQAPAVQRMLTGIGELDRVLGGGLVPGSLVLLGGSPGIGKSTHHHERARRPRRRWAQRALRLGRGVRRPGAPAGASAWARPRWRCRSSPRRTSRRCWRRSRPSAPTPA